MKNVDLIVVNYRTSGLTFQAVSSVIKCCKIASVTIVDNSACSVEWKDLLFSFGLDSDLIKDSTIDTYISSIPVRFLNSERNLGFGAGCNFAVNNLKINSDFLWFFNSDAYVTTDALTPLLEAAINYPFSCVSSIVYSTSNSNSQSFKSSIQVCSVKNYAGWFRNENKLPRSTARNSVEFLPSDFVYGASFLLSRVNFDLVGGFDEKYFMYLEETDLSLRINRLTKKGSCFCINSKVYHHGGSSPYSSFDKEIQILSNYKYFISKNYKGLMFALAYFWLIIKTILVLTRIARKLFSTSFFAFFKN